MTQEEHQMQMEQQHYEESMQRSPEINELATALAKAQGKITGALKDSNNPFFKSKYADLASCWDACRHALSENGLAVIQLPAVDDIGVTVTTLLTHSSGQFIQCDLLLQPKDTTPQSIGSCISYGRRYGLTSMLGIAQVDDDGNAASARSTEITGDISHIDNSEAVRAANEVRNHLTADVREDVRMLQLYDMHDALNARGNEFYIAVAAELSAKEKSAFKQYVTMAKKKEKEDRATQAF